MRKVVDNFVWILFSILSILAIVIVYKNSDDLFFYDQYELVANLVKNQNIFSIFNFEYAPHRQGLAFVFWWLIQQFVGIDARIPTWISMFFIIFAAYLAIVASKKIAGNSILDLLIPIVVISPKLHESVIGVSNPSHGPFPLFMIFLIVLILNKSENFYRSLLLSICIFLITFSGFGLVILPIALFYSLIPLLNIFYAKSKVQVLKLHKIIRIRLLLLFSTLATMILFLRGYVFNSAVTCFTGEINILSQTKYITIILGHAIGFTELRMSTYIFGGILLLLLLILFFISIRYLLVQEFNFAKQQFFYESILFTSGFSLCFVFLTSYGRECLGFETAFASRYLAYVLPGIWALILFIKFKYRKYAKKNKKIHLLIFLIFFYISLEWSANRYWMFWVHEWHSKKMQINSCTEGDVSKIIYCQDKLKIVAFPDTNRLQELIKEIYEI